MFFKQKAQGERSMDEKIMDEEIVTVSGKPLTVAVGVRVRYSQYKRMIEEARKNGVGLSDWLRNAIDTALKKSSEENEPEG
ncbi:MAG: hypothetical protein D6706_21625 [Chloroflexi bacterium]|nr:MAG: hypothetical protein D6706_21625 [Chloroflexota bacterium]